MSRFVKPVAITAPAYAADRAQTFSRDLAVRQIPTVWTLDPTLLPQYGGGALHLDSRERLCGPAQSRARLARIRSAAGLLVVRSPYALEGDQPVIWPIGSEGHLDIMAALGADVPVLIADGYSPTDHPGCELPLDQATRLAAFGVDAVPPAEFDPQNIEYIVDRFYPEAAA